MLPYKTGHFLIDTETSKSPTFHANMVDRQALFNFWGQKPYQNITQSLRRKTVLKDEDYEMYTPFTDFLKTNSRSITVNENKIRFSKTAKGQTHFRVMKTVTGTPGLRRQNFNVIFNTDAWKQGDKIGPAEGLQFLAVVQSLPRPVGGQFEYSLRSLDPNESRFFPLAYLKETTRWVRRGSPNFSEASSGWGSILWEQGHAVLTWEVGLFKTGYELKITDEALRHVWTMDPCDKDRNPIPDMPKSFISEAEMHMLKTAERAMEEDLLWSQYNYTIPDNTTRLVRQIGAGVFDFIKDGNVRDYNIDNFSIKELYNWQDTCWYNNFGRVTYGTGRPGLEIAHESILREFGELSVIRDYDHYVERTGNIVPGGAEAWKLKKPMFNAYELPIGGVIEFEHWPWLDDRSSRGTKHPRTGRPLLGYNFIAMRWEGQEEQSNIVLVNKEGGEIFGYQAGAVGPYGSINDRQGGKYTMTHDGRWATLRYGNEYGLFAEDVNDFIFYRPDVIA